MSLVSDGGPPFNSAEFKSFLYEWDVEHIVTSPYNSRSNGQAESSVKIVKNMLRKCLESKTDPYICSIVAIHKHFEGKLTIACAIINVQEFENELAGQKQKTQAKCR